MTTRSKRGDMVARAAAIAGGAPRPALTTNEGSTGDGRDAQGDAVTAAPPQRTAPRTRPVRMVVELQPVEHRQLKRMADGLADRLELTSVAMAEVVRVLLTLAQRDPALADQVAEELAKTGGTRRR